MFTAVIVFRGGLPEEASQHVSALLAGVGRGVEVMQFFTGLDELRLILADGARQARVEGKVLLFDVATTAEANDAALRAILKEREERAVQCKVHVMNLGRVFSDSREEYARDLDIPRDRYGDRDFRAQLNA